MLARVRIDDALRALYQAPHEQFVAERKRLAAALRAAGDRAGAAKLAKIARPPISAWAVNQLYWHARDSFDELLATAGQLRHGDLAATSAHREAIAKLRQRAANMLADAGHPATEATLRRVTTNLSAIAAAGDFAPDPPGELAADRAAPGFEAAGIAGVRTAATRPAHEAEDHRGVDRQQRAEARARARAERERVAAALRTARGELDAAERRVHALERELRGAEAAVAKQRKVVEELERTHARSDEDDE